MIQISIYRTDPAQIAAKGRAAFSKLTLKNSSLEQAVAYARKLADDNKIICPYFEITKIPPAK